MSAYSPRHKQRVAQEAERCAVLMFHELTNGQPRPELWYVWYLCERHGGIPLLHNAMPKGQIAFWDGEDIVIDAGAPIAEVIAALPEELAHRLSSRETPRFEWLNHDLHWAHEMTRADFHELVGQQVAALFAFPQNADGCAGE